MQLATVRLYGFNGLIQLAAIGRKGGILQNKNRYPSGLVSDNAHTPFYGSSGKQFCVAEACDDGLKRITVLLCCDLNYFQ